MTDERLHDLDTVLTYEEIEELRNICYQHGNSWCPISDFFNDIERTKNANYNKNQAFKDLWLIVNIILEKEKKLKDYQEIREIAKHYNWDDITSEIFNVKTDKKYRDLFNSAIVNIQEDYRKARALMVIKKHIKINAHRIFSDGYENELTQEEYDLLKEVLL